MLFVKFEILLTVTSNYTTFSDSFTDHDITSYCAYTRDVKRIVLIPHRYAFLAAKFYGNV